MIVWQPRSRTQELLCSCPVYEVFFGGARGGGKTDGVIGKYANKEKMYGGNFNGILFRHELPQADDLVDRAQEILVPLGWAWVGYTKTFTSPRGGRLRIRPLESIADAAKYQGQNLTDVAIEEAGNYPSYDPIARLHGCLRSAKGVPTQMLLTGNPGGPGQGWLKERYIDPAPLGMTIINQELPNGNVKQRIYIPSRLTDNPVLMENDPGYLDNLYLVGSAELVRAWLEGDFDAIEGAYFDNWSKDKHVVEPFRCPPHWTKFRAMDWGSAAPFCVLWFAVVSEAGMYGGKFMPVGALVVYREWYGKGKKNNTGLKLTSQLVADGIAERSPKEEKYAYSVLDPAAFAEDGGPSLAENMMVQQSSVAFIRADNKRVGKTGAMVGWNHVRHRLNGNGDHPMLFVADCCKDLIRTLPLMQHDQVKAEDLDTKMEDHAVDTLRYGCASRPMTAKPVIHLDPERLNRTTFSDMLKSNTRNRR
ncbi:MAG: hypothetical protein V3R25_10290 [Nitrosomonadaceae bacterium]